MKKSKSIALVLALIVLGVLFILIGGLLTILTSDYSLTSNFYHKEQTLSLAEAGVDQAISQLKTNSSYTGETTNLSSGDFTVTISDIDSSHKRIESKGCYPSATNCKSSRTVRVVATTTPSSSSIAFHYAIQGGTGGINVTGSSEIEGNLYSNGNINFSGSSSVTGDAAAHGTVNPNPYSGLSGIITIGAPIIPLPSVNTEIWKTYATNGGTITGNYSAPSGTTDLGPKKITGDFNMTGSNSTINLTGPLYIQGNLSISGSGTQIKLSDAFGANGTVILVDGTISITGSGQKFMTNASGSFIMVISNSSNSNAISYTGSGESDGLVMYATYGGMSISGSGEIVAMCAQTLNISGSGKILYRTGLPSTIFTGGPGGTWTITPGSWTEVKQ